jgi:two-component system phosphate regulon sensor histidine kinase PhoR
VLGEPSQISRLVNNLVSNAIHYTEAGQVCVRTFMNDDDVCLMVEDTGIGIEPEDLPHLFERFYRGRRVRQSPIHGTGLGLAIVKEIADIHSGIIELNSEVGRGTRFVVRFPATMGEPWLVR